MAGLAPELVGEECVQEVEVLGNVEEADVDELFNDEPPPAPLLQPSTDAAEQESEAIFQEHEEAEEPCAQRRALPDPGQPTQKPVSYTHLTLPTIYSV